eukprot:snap_masked-scaffold_66-processed-gene-0.52-mRNA-1 protein AED:1.00 eAED:1.00 QI:0/-1/0/0/-1/1/1/0/80
MAPSEKRRGEDPAQPNDNKAEGNAESAEVSPHTPQFCNIKEKDFLSNPMPNQVQIITDQFEAIAVEANLEAALSSHEKRI